MTKLFPGRVACCTLNKIGRKAKYYLNGISNYNVSDLNNRTAFIKSG